MESKLEGLLEEIHQTKPFASLEQEAFLAVLRTAGVLVQRQAPALKKQSLTGTQYNTLRILRGARPLALTCSDIGERLVTPGPDVTRILDRLEARGMVRRERDEKDRRVVRARITELGLEVLASLDEPVERRLVAVLGHLGPDKLESLIHLLAEARRPM